MSKHKITRKSIKPCTILDYIDLIDCTANNNK